MTITGSTASENGGAIYATGYTSVDGSTVSGNTAGGAGGGCFGGTVNMFDTTVSNNRATGSGGGLDVAQQTWLCAPSPITAPPTAADSS